MSGTQSETGDVVVTVPMGLWWDWIEEGVLPGDPPGDELWDFYTGGGVPERTKPGDRCYVVAHGRVRGYAPIVRVEGFGRGGVSFIRAGGAVAVTIPEGVRGFQGWRYRWWGIEDEQPFPGWRTEGVRP